MDITTWTNVKCYLEYLREVLEGAKGTKVPSAASEHANFLAPLTYITPNYMALEYFAVIAAISRIGKHTMLLLHDNNLFVHDYFINQFKRINVTSFNKYVEGLQDEIATTMEMLGANMDNITVIKSSDIWLQVFHDKNNFLNFYRLLGKIRVTENIDTDVKRYQYNANYTMQAVLDIYFALNSDIFPSTLPPVDGVIVESRKYGTYSHILETLASDYGYNRNLTKPSFYLFRPVPFIMHEDMMPSCHMDRQTIRYLTAAANLKSKDFQEFTHNYFIPMRNLLSSLGILPKAARTPDSKTPDEIADNLHMIMRPFDEKLLKHKSAFNKEINIASRAGLEELRGIIGSDLTYRLLAECNGEQTISEIARALRLQVSNTSHYVNRLRAAGMLTADKKPMVKASRVTIDVAELLPKLL